MLSCAVKPQSPMSVLVASTSFSRSSALNSRAGRRAHRVRAVRIGRGGLVGDELAERLPARAVLRGEAERGRERLDAGFLAGGVSVFLEPEEVLHQHQLGERRAVLLLRDRRELLAEGREARVGVGLRRRDRERRVGRGRRGGGCCCCLLLRRRALLCRCGAPFCGGGGPFCAAGGGGPSLPGRGNVPCAAAGRASIPAIKIVVEMDRIRIVASSAPNIP